VNWRIVTAYVPPHRSVWTAKIVLLSSLRNPRNAPPSLTNPCESTDSVAPSGGGASGPMTLAIETRAAWSSRSAW